MIDYKKIRCYSWSLVVYASDIEILSALVNNQHLISHYAYIRHDRDVDDNNEIKKSHTHILITFTQNYSLRRISSLFGFECLGQKLSNRFLAYEYLMHLNDTDKIIYSEDDIYTNDRNYYIESCARDRDIEKNNSILEMLDGIIAHRSYRTMVQEYGKDYVLNYEKYLLMARLINYQESKGNYDLEDLKSDLVYFKQTQSNN